MEHNYDNDPEYLDKKEKLINFRNNFPLYEEKLIVRTPGVMALIKAFEANIDKYLSTNVFKKIKHIFREDKNKKDYFDEGYFNIAIHIRRHNLHDSRIEGTDTPDNIYESLINKLRLVYSSKKFKIHIFSQGNQESFKFLQAGDVVLHLNDTVEESFPAMVFADVLVVAKKLI